ncbi:hypothetical protein K1719_042265 [Acacia pycnantha]|nr:hypothetical protein K1719_042265 [Acacia pycnantha]
MDSLGSWILITNGFESEHQGLTIQLSTDPYLNIGCLVPVLFNQENLNEEEREAKLLDVDSERSRYSVSGDFDKNAIELKLARMDSNNQ